MLQMVVDTPRGTLAGPVVADTDLRGEKMGNTVSYSQVHTAFANTKGKEHNSVLMCTCAHNDGTGLLFDIWQDR